MTDDPYGRYILRTGESNLRSWELILGRHLYASHFAGLPSVLDVGAGRCWFTRQAPDHIVGLDNSREVVDHYAGQGLQMVFGEADRLPFPDKTFSGLFSCWLLEHLLDPLPATREFYRVLKPDGFCFLIVPTPGDLAAFYEDYTHVRPYTSASLLQLAEAAGFSKVKLENLLWTRGGPHVLRHFGAGATSQFLRFSDQRLRRLGLINRNHLTMQAWRTYG